MCVPAGTIAADPVHYTAFVNICIRAEYVIRCHSRVLFHLTLIVPTHVRVTIGMRHIRLTHLCI